jgi:adenosylcobinamide amidohydrolase
MLKQFELAVKSAKLVLEENVLAVLSDCPLNTFSSAIHNGGLKKTKVIVNAQVTKEYGDSLLHDDPEAFIQLSYRKLRLAEDFVGMITFASVEDFSLVSKRDGDLAVSVVATAGCTHAESAGEEITLQEIAGTINIMILIDGNPIESCLASCIITATEAKTAALRELDVRSRYSGAEATGTITDAMVVAKTGCGAEVVYAGPASQLGQLIGWCTRKAVKEAVEKGIVGGFTPNRSIIERLRERHLSVEKLASELAKVKSIHADEKTIAENLRKKLGEPAFASALLAAVKLDEDYKKGLAPPELGKANAVGIGFGELLSGQPVADAELRLCELPSFLRQVLVALITKALSDGKN